MILFPWRCMSKRCQSCVHHALMPAFFERKKGSRKNKGCIKLCMKDVSDVSLFFSSGCGSLDLSEILPKICKRLVSPRRRTWTSSNSRNMLHVHGGCHWDRSGKVVCRCLRSPEPQNWRHEDREKQQKSENLGESLQLNTNTVQTSKHKDRFHGVWKLRLWKSCTCLTKKTRTIFKSLGIQPHKPKITSIIWNRSLKIEKSLWAVKLEEAAQKLSQN